jgi:hypothetical protein
MVVGVLVDECIRILSLILLIIKLHLCCVQQNQNHHQYAARDAVYVVLFVVLLSRGIHSLYK